MLNSLLSPFIILGISNNHSREPANTTCKQGNPGQQPQLLQTIQITNPTNRAGRCRGEGGIGEERISSKHPKRKTTFTGDSMHPPNRTIEPDETLPARAIIDDYTTYVFVAPCELQETRKKAKERNECLWQLLLQRNTVPANPYCPVVVVPSCSPAFATTIPRTFPKVQHYLSKSGFQGQQRRRRLRRPPAFP